MLKPSRNLDFSSEPLDAEFRRYVWGEHLDDDLATERALFRDEHSGHGAAGQFPTERIRIAE